MSRSIRNLSRSRDDRHGYVDRFLFLAIAVPQKLFFLKITLLFLETCVTFVPKMEIIDKVTWLSSDWTDERLIGSHLYTGSVFGIVTFGAMGECALELAEVVAVFPASRRGEIVFVFLLSVEVAVFGEITPLSSSEWSELEGEVSWERGRLLVSLAVGWGTGNKLAVSRERPGIISVSGGNWVVPFF